MGPDGDMVTLGEGTTLRNKPQYYNNNVNTCTELIVNIIAIRNVMLMYKCMAKRPSIHKLTKPASHLHEWTICIFQLITNSIMPFVKKYLYTYKFTVVN